MGPHPDPTSLPVEKQLRLLRHSLDKVQSQVSALGVRLQAVENEVKLLRTDVKDLHKRFDKQDKKFDKLYNMIDKFTGRIRKQDGEIAAIRFRKEEHETRISKLENRVFGTAA